MNIFYKDIDVGGDSFNYTMDNKDYLLKLIMKQLNLTNEDLHLRTSDLKNKIRDNKLNVILED